jgi:hypothetical protein
MIPGERIIELLLQIVLEAMHGQSPEHKKQMWDWYIQDVMFWRRVLKIDKE